MTILSDLPIEIMRFILEIAIDPGRLTYSRLKTDDDPLSKYREHQALIRELGSVCHCWRSICLEFLFEHVWIAPPLLPNTLAFRQIFDMSTPCGHSRKPPGWWTQQLYLDGCFLEPPERKALADHFQINNPFPNVKHLFIFDYGSKEDEENARVILGVYAKHLASLMLKGPVHTLRNMISCAPGGLFQLQELALDFAWVIRESFPRQDTRDPLVLPNVHSLHLHNLTKDECLALLDWSFPSLRTLAIYRTIFPPDAFARFMHLHGSMLISLSIPYDYIQPSTHRDLFEACRVLERLEVLDGTWADDWNLEPPSITYFPIMEEHGLREWIFKPFWVDSEFFDTKFKDFTADPKLFPSLQKIRLSSPGMEKLFSISSETVQGLRDWSRALKVKGVSLVDDEDGISIFPSTICVGRGSDQCSSSLFPIILYSLRRATP